MRNEAGPNLTPVRFGSFQQMMQEFTNETRVACTCVFVLTIEMTWQTRERTTCRRSSGRPGVHFGTIRLIGRLAIRPADRIAVIEISVSDILAEA